MTSERIDSGRLRQKIEIQRRTEEQTSSGAVVERWESICTVHADAVCTDSKQENESGAIRHEALYRFRIRWRPGITADMRVRWKSRTFEMVGPPADWQSERVGLTLLCRELV